MADEAPHPLEYALTEPPPEGPTFSLKRLLVLGYVAACVIALNTMSVVMAMRG